MRLNLKNSTEIFIDKTEKIRQGHGQDYGQVSLTLQGKAKEENLQGSLSLTTSYMRFGMNS